MSGLSLAHLRKAFSDLGVTRAYAKFLRPNDNSKNQIYVGSDFTSFNILPVDQPVAEATGKAGAILKADLQLSWLDDDGTTHRAPAAKLIWYPQYPELRISGLLEGVERRHRPSSIMGTTRGSGRVLVLGVREDRSIIAYAGAAGSPIARQLSELPDPEMTGVLMTVPLTGSLLVASRHRLLKELCRISNAGWISSKRLYKEGEPKPYTAQNAGGYTLEAELAIRPNGHSEPDFHGWEVKQYGLSSFASKANPRITLMTPEPSDGFYVSHGLVPFVMKYGYTDRRGRPDRRNFGGTFRKGEREARTRLTMELLGFDAGSQAIVDSRGGIALIDDRGAEAAVWRYADLLAHWNRKHAFAVYVPSVKRERDGVREYRYGTAVQLGTGTSFNNFLAALDASIIFYDPGIRISTPPAPPDQKKRNQFRAKLKGLAGLYTSFETVDACA